MNDSGETSQRISFVLLIAFGVLLFLGMLFLFWNENQSFASLVSLKNDDISEITIFDNTGTHKSPLLTLNNPRDSEAIEEFVNAMNNTTHGRGRDIITLHELYLIIKLNNSRNLIELLFQSQSDCGKTIFIEIVKKPGGVKSRMTTYVSSATSEIYLYDWLHNLDIINYLGCK